MHDIDLRPTCATEQSLDRQSNLIRSKLLIESSAVSEATSDKLSSSIGIDSRSLPSKQMLRVILSRLLAFTDNLGCTYIHVSQTRQWIRCPGGNLLSSSRTLVSYWCRLPAAKDEVSDLRLTRTAKARSEAPCSSHHLLPRADGAPTCSDGSCEAARGAARRLVERAAAQWEGCAGTPMELCPCSTRRNPHCPGSLRG